MTPLIGFAPDLEQTTEGAILDGEGFSPTTRGIEASKSWRWLADLYDPSVYGTAVAALNTESDNLFVATGTHVLNIQKFEGVDPTITDITPASYTPGSNPAFYRYGADVILSGLLVAYHTSDPTTQMTAISGSQREPGFARGFYHLRWYLREWFGSDEGDPTDFTVGPSSNAATGTFPDSAGNIIDGAALGEFAVMYKRNAVWIGRFANSTVKWAWQRVPTIDGCAYNGSLIALRDAHYYFSERNIFRFDGGRPVPIGEPVRKWLSKWIGLGYTRIRAVHSPVNDSIIWYLGTPNSSFAGEARFILALEYHVESGRFGVQRLEMDCPVPSEGPVYLNQLPTSDGPHEQLYMLKGGALYARDGAAGSASMTLNQYGDDDRDTGAGRVWVSYSKRPGAATLTHVVRDYLDGGVLRSQTSENANGQHDLRVSGRWHQNSLLLSGDWIIRGVRQQPERIEGRR